MYDFFSHLLTPNHAQAQLQLDKLPEMYYCAKIQGIHRVVYMLLGENQKQI